MSIDTQRLRDLFQRAPLARLIGRLRERLERGKDLAGVITLDAPTEEERAALDRLFGKVSAGRALRVDLDRLAAIVRDAGVCADLRDVVELLEGPITDRRERAAAEALAWRAAIDAGCAQVPDDAVLREWLSDPAAKTLLRRLAAGRPEVVETLLRQAWTVLRRLPAAALPLAELAASAGNSHALDLGEPLSTLVLRVLAHASGSEPPIDAEGRRLAWASAGVLCDELSAPVLVLNLPAAGDDATARALRLHAEAGEPYRLSARQLLRTPPRFLPPGARRVFLCENPTVVAAAALRLGAVSAPLACTEGQPKTALRLLAEQLGRAGFEIRHHGDFDWAGVQIANTMLRRFGARPWRMEAEDYVAAPAGPPLDGSPVEASWSERLSAEMRRRGAAVHEEQILGDLLHDLERCGGARR